MTERLNRHRMDFVVKWEPNDDEGNSWKVSFIPDPRRYDQIQRDGEFALYDRLDDVFIPATTFADLVRQMENVPMTWERPQVDSTSAYVQERRTFLSERTERLQHIDHLGSDDHSDAFLQALAGDRLAFVIMIVDIEGSTKLASRLAPEDYEQIIDLTLFELGEAVAQFNGQVLKNTGDGIIAYFAEPSFNTKNDLAAWCAITILQVVEHALNPALTERGLPHISVRIAIDAGEAAVRFLGSPTTKRHADIIGTVVNVTSKIADLTPPNEIFFGETAIRNLHTHWRLMCEEMPERFEWTGDDDETEYRIYRFAESANDVGG